MSKTTILTQVKYSSPPSLTGRVSYLYSILPFLSIPILDNNPYPLFWATLSAQFVGVIQSLIQAKSLRIKFARAMQLS